MTNAEGFVIFANEACERLAGREAVLGEDRWCISWKLYSDAGEPVSPDQCFMALAIREMKAFRGVTGIVEWPNGSRVAFKAFPTPVFGRDGDVIGGFHVVIPAPSAADTPERAPA